MACMGWHPPSCLSLRRCRLQTRPETCAAAETASRQRATSSCRGCTPRAPIGLCSTLMQPPCRQPHTHQRRHEHGTAEGCDVRSMRVDPLADFKTAAIVVREKELPGMHAGCKQAQGRAHLLADDDKGCVVGDGNPVARLAGNGL